ncbi:MAG: class I SAM-dependent methyltransferase [Anaerolineae bacterium]
MQAYGEGFAYIYNMRWTHFAQNVAPRIREFYKATPIGGANQRVLDLACGTGQLAVYFLDHGYHVVGVDLSPGMLEHARRNAADYVEQGQARFVEADVADFTPQDVDAADQPFGLAVSTFDALNHLPDFAALEDCMQATYDALAPGGWFIFDLNSRFGLRRWASINIEEYEDLVLIARGVIVEDEDRAYTQISGFLQEEDGRYKRFNEVAYNTIFDLSDVKEALEDTGFSHVHFGLGDALEEPLESPEDHSRVFIVAQK